MQMDARLIEAANLLWSAQVTGIPCPPIRNLVNNAEEAYTVQQYNIARAITERDIRLVGRKIGLTSEAVQHQLGVNEPDYGALFDHMVTRSGETVPMLGLLQPKVEAEVALVLGSNLNIDNPSIAQVLAATDHLLPAIEIVDSRIANWDITLVDTVADNASCGRLVLGTEPVSPSAVDLVKLTMTMAVNGEIVSSGTGAACLGNPLIAAQWLAATMTKLGTPLEAGDVVLTGALGPMAAVAPGDQVVAELPGLGSVSVNFEGHN